MNEEIGKIRPELEKLLVSHDLNDVRRLVSRLAGVEAGSERQLLKHAEGGDWLRLGGEDFRVLERFPSLGDEDALPPVPVDLTAIPLQTEAHHEWGLLLVPPAEEARARNESASLELALRHLELLENFEACTNTKNLSYSIHELVLDLLGTSTLDEAIAAVNLACIKLLGSEKVFLALPRESELEIRSSSGEASPSYFTVDRADWKKLLDCGENSWDAETDSSRWAATIFRTPDAPGAIVEMGGQSQPVGWLAVVGCASNPVNRLEWLDRIASALGKWLSHTNPPNGSEKKSKWVSELFVMLAQEKERLDYVVRSIPLGILLCDEKGGILMSNDRVVKALGLTNVEIRERKIFRSREEGRFLLGLVAKAKTEGYGIETPCRLEGRWHNIGVTPWPGGGQFLVVTQDIERWFKLDKFKGDLISIISHELKNPLTAIINASHLMNEERAGSLNDNQKKMAMMIEDNGYKIRELLDDVVRLSRIEATGGKTDLVALKPLLIETRENFKRTIEGKGLVWKEELLEESVPGDRGMFVNLFNNLVGNAVKYVSIGGSAGIRMERDGGDICVRVIDNGPGIPEKDRPKLFTPFFRGSNVKESVTGTGLGLVIARNVVERLGGSLLLHSPLPPEDLFFLGVSGEEQPGSAFEIRLPASEEE